MSFIIDRFEGEFAVVEAIGKTYNIPKDLLPSDAKEGSVIEISVNEAETDKRFKEAKSLLKSLFNETE